MQVLRSFRSRRAPLSNAELVRRTGFSKATVSRLTSTLLQLGFIRHVPGGREFELATAAFGIGHAYLAASDVVQKANPFLQELADRLNMSMALAIGEGLDMLYLGFRASQRVATLRLGVGTVMPMATTSIGHAYLWGLPTVERKRLLGELRTQYGQQWGEVSKGIRESFGELERTGTCGVLGGYQRDAYGVALPVCVGRDQILMGLSCGKAEIYPDLPAQHKRVAPVLKRAAADFERLLADC